MATPSKEFVPWRDVEPERSDTWITADDFQIEVDEAKELQAESHAEREFYDNDSYWFTGTGSTYFHGERG